MQLILSGDLASAAPSATDIALALYKVKNGSEEFLILERNTMHYMQAAANDGCLILEYQEGSLDKHYAGADNCLSVEQATRILTSYLQDDHRWKTDLEWVKQKL